VRQGAEDYLIKDDQGEYLDILPRVVSNALARTQIRTENRNYRDCLEHIIRQRVDEMEQILLEQQAANQQKSMETLTHHHRLESLGKLTAGLAHEINNPLNGIINYGDLILMDVDYNSPAFRWASGVVEESLKIAAIVRNLLSYAHGGEEMSGPFIVEEIIEGTLSLVRHGFLKHHISISTDLAEDLPLVRCRRQSIQQVLLSLLDNAKDALNDRFSGYDENKRIVIRGHRIERDGTLWARVTVEDSGSGLQDAVADRAFEPFYTTKTARHAAGLGLPISLHIIKSHGGDLAMESEPGRDTRIHIDLPGDLG
jgi:signal transduction histidine kinase